MYRPVPRIYGNKTIELARLVLHDGDENKYKLNDKLIQFCRANEN